MRYLGLIGLVLLAGCNKGAAPGETASKAAGGAEVQFQPGQWSTTTEIVSMDMPGAPAGVKDAMLSAAKTAGSKTMGYCLTPEQAKKPSSAMFTGPQQIGCTYNRFSMAGGRIDMAMSCKPPQASGMTVAMTMTGPMTPASYELATDQKITSPQLPSGTMTMKAKTIGKRVGDCKA